MVVLVKFGVAIAAVRVRRVAGGVGGVGGAGEPPDEPEEEVSLACDASERIPCATSGMLE